MNWLMRQVSDSVASWPHSLSLQFLSGELGRVARYPCGPKRGVGRFDEPLLGVDVDRPVEVGLTVPLRRLGLLVELVERRTGALLVVPREDGIRVVAHGVDRL